MYACVCISSYYLRPSWDSLVLFYRATRVLSRPWSISSDMRGTIELKQRYACSSEPVAVISCLHTITAENLSAGTVICVAKVLRKIFPFVLLAPAIAVVFVTRSRVGWVYSPFSPCYSLSSFHIWRPAWTGQPTWYLRQAGFSCRWLWSMRHEIVHRLYHNAIKEKVVGRKKECMKVESTALVG